jgi:hypothetical protein
MNQSNHYINKSEAVIVDIVLYYFQELDEETKWIRGHIKRRECSSFIPPANTPEEE